MTGILVRPQRVAVPGGTGWLVLEAFEEDGELICGVFQLTGRLRLPPKAWLRTIRGEMQKLEQLARASGAAEMRVAGRCWARVLTDYEPFVGVRNGLRKRL